MIETRGLVRFWIDHFDAILRLDRACDLSTLQEALIC